MAGMGGMLGPGPGGPPGGSMPPWGMGPGPGGPPFGGPGGGPPFGGPFGEGESATFLSPLREMIFKIFYQLTLTTMLWFRIQVRHGEFFSFIIAPYGTT
jgi:hypothetical protein